MPGKVNSPRYSVLRVPNKISPWPFISQGCSTGIKTTDRIASRLSSMNDFPDVLRYLYPENARNIHKLPY